MSQHLESSRQQEALFVGKFFMNFPSKSRSTVKQNVSKRIATLNSGASLDQNKTTTTVDPTSVGGNISRLNTSTDDSLRTSVELLNPPTNSSTDLLENSCGSDAEGCSLRERSDTFSIPSKESGPQPFLSADVIADSSAGALENSIYALTNVEFDSVHGPLRRPSSTVTKIRTAIDESQKYNFGVFTGTYPVRHKSTGTGPCTHVKDGLQPYQPLQHSNCNSKHTHRLFPNRTNRERTNINVDRELKIGKVRLLSLCNLDVISLTTASMDISLPSIGMSAASSVARGSPELYTKDEVIKNYEIKIENEKLVLAIAIIKKGDGMETGEEIMKGEEIGEGEDKKGEEREGEERELEQEEIKLRRKDIEEEVEVLESDLPATLSTIPNKYCSLSEAQGLKQLISIPTAQHKPLLLPACTSVMDMYMVGRVVGVGSYGKVRVAWHRLTCAKVAIKTYDKAKVKDSAHWKRVNSEINIMQQISHPRICRLYQALETPKRMHLIMEHLDGTNLCTYVKMKTKLQEEEASWIFFQLLQAVDYLHSTGVTHRDIKLENVLFVHPVDCKDIKLIDFGFSTICKGKNLKIFCGTPSYMAPEIVQRQEYDGLSVDMWSVGIFLYALLCGVFPFRAKNYPDLYRRISRGTYEMPDEIGLTARHLISQLLCVNPKQRISAKTAINHPWLAKYNSASIDINRLRFDSSILISNRPEDDIDEQTLKELELFGLNRTELVRLIMTKTHSSTSTLYYLLLNHIINKRALLGGPKRASSTPLLNPILHCNVTHKPKEVMANTVPRTSILRYGISALQSAVLSTVSIPTAHPCVAAQPTELQHE